MNVHAKSELINKIPSDLTRCRDLIETACKLSDAVRKAGEEVNQNPHLSAEGKAAALRRHVLGDGRWGLVPQFKQIKETAAQSRAETQSAKAAMRPTPLDKSDVVGAILDGEQRSFLRSLPDGERAGLALSDPSFALAVLRAPAALSKLSPDVIEHVLDAQLKRQYGDRVDALQAQEDVDATVDAALKVVEAEIKRDGGLSDDDF